MIRNDLDNIEVPENIDDTINLAIDKIREVENKKIITKRKTLKKVAMVASLTIIMGVASVVVAKPTWAGNLPVIGDLIQKTLIDVNSKYKDYIQVVGQTKSDKGIDITFESAVADNNRLNLSFIVKNNNESIENNITDAMLIPTSLKVNGKKVSTGAGGSHEVIDENTIRVLKNINWDYNELPNKLNVEIEISNMYGKNGDWDVRFALDVSEIRRNTHVEKLDKVINVNGVDVNLAEVTMSPFTTNIKSFSSTIRYTAGDEGLIQFIIIDEDGIEVEAEGMSCSDGEVENEIKQNNMHINNSNTNALNITPFYLKSGSRNQNINEGKLPPVKINIESFSPIDLKINDYVSININNYVVYGEYLIYEYSYKFLGTTISDIPFGNTYICVDGVAVDDNYSEEERAEIENLRDKYIEENSKNRVRIVKIGTSKNIEIGCYDGSSIEILKEQAFTVTKK